MRGFPASQRNAFLLLLALIVVCPFFVSPVFLMNVLCFAMLACAFNLLIGFVGLMSFGHAAFFGIGSYVSGYAAKNWGFSAELCVLFGGAVGGLLGVVFGWIAIRRQGIYFAMITLALAQMVYFFCVQVPFTHGEDGIQQIPSPPLFGIFSLASDLRMYVFVVAVFLIFFVLIYRIIHSPFGQIMKAIRENEPRATSLGYRTNDYKLIAFTLSCFIAGIAGGTKVLVFNIATLTDVMFTTSGDIVLMDLVGGMGTIFGPVVGALVLKGIEYFLNGIGSWVTVAQGCIFVICVLAFRRGIVGEIGARLKIAL